ncbi:ATP synthase F1 subunit delta [Chitinophaga sancti]|uniref:ATP synthase subunit delta n=1 Tax=Chitinophaga sancti TaxID=1004 RepID=A0A1K1S9J7_9BACT|nr:ATP synthase F1 subunit delta [Chitinophaga sancti]WQD60937.1 ATP synthase F1 subunit delta [Chitinophaga sancti]WQG86935.1 ATP synthase F1 subunit delta [Chitinophaga sancti]SFW80874.1 F-type H+-transporting ATPase subunit delta [Chitinophaga sancti]
MRNPRLASRYAKSLIDLSSEKGQLEAVQADMLFLQQLSKTNPDVVSVLKSPIIKPEKKQQILAAILNSRVSAITSAFVKLLVIKGREGNLPEIAGEYLRQYNTLKGISKVRITTAVPVDAGVLNVIKQKAEAGSDKKIELETAVNAELIGGFVLETEDKLFDASVLRDLKDIRKQFEGNVFVPELK